MVTNRKENKTSTSDLKTLLEQRILVIDGAMGTALEALKPAAADYGGEMYFGCNEMLCANAPHIVLEVHRAYLEAGADIIETNSFNGSPVVLMEFGIPEMAERLARRSAELAREAVDKWDCDRPVFVMGSMGPGTKTISVTGGITYDEILESYRVYARGLLEGGVDILLLETVQDTLNLKAAWQGIQTAQSELGKSIPVAVSVTIETGGTMLAGQSIEALYHTVSGFDLFSLGINCATGPEFMTDHLRTLSALSRFPVSVMPNAGMPDHNGNYSDDPLLFKKVIGSFARKGFINIAGGCCGTTPEHIRAMKQAVEGIKPRKPFVNGHFPALAGTEPMLVESDNRPVYVGERTNTIGSRKFKRLIGQGKWNEAAEIGREQVRRGAMVLDVCTADPGRVEKDDLIRVLRPLLRKVRVPVLIDTTDLDVVEAALKVIGGKPAINSVNLEDGGVRLRKTASLAKRYGASLICGMIDDDPEDSMAVAMPRKLEIAERMYNILKNDHDIPDTDIIFDPLVFPAATGDTKYLGSARSTIDTIRALRQQYPDCLTILGISNVSFGLPPAGREVLNSVFLHLCSKAGLDMAIVNTQRLRRYPSIAEEERVLAEKLLMKGDDVSIRGFTDRYRDVEIAADQDDLDFYPIGQRVRQAVIDARRDGLENSLDELLLEHTPLEIINGQLMEGMNEVGRLFNDNRLIVAEVLESAEVMKKAVDYLRLFMPPGESARIKGKMVLATVKGDVHDIGKNLVDMIMSNNGFEIVNLGIKVAPEAIIAAVQEHRPDIIGLSGLLVRSTQQMVHTAHDLASAGIRLPMLVGGAALTRKFTSDKIAAVYGGDVYYAPNAMEGLRIGNEIVNLPDKNRPVEPANSLESAAVENKQKETFLHRDASESGSDEIVPVETEPSIIRTGIDLKSHWIETTVPEPPDLEEHVDTSISLDDVLPYLDRRMLFGNFLGMRQAGKRLSDLDDGKVKQYDRQIADVLESGRKSSVLQPRSIYRWCRAQPDSDSILLDIPGAAKQFRLKFPRSKGDGGISATDWLRPRELGGDTVGLFVVTAGNDTAELAAQLRGKGELLGSHILQSLALSIAEATAEFIHFRMRKAWGFPDLPELKMADLLKAKYRGIRLSFGYPACPDLEDQVVLFEILRPERIGVTLTESYMMHPESSVTALVFHHPQGRYYTV